MNMLARIKRIDYTIIAQVLFCIGAITFVVHFTPLAKYLSLAIADTTVYSGFVAWASSFLPTNLVRWAPARYIYLLISLAFYGLMLWWEGKSSYPPLLTRQPIIKPFLFGFILMGALNLVWELGSLMAGFGSVSFVSDGSLLLGLGAFGLDLVIKFSNNLAEELIFRGYSITRLSKATGPIFAVWCSAVLFMLVHYAYIDVSLFSFQTLHWTLAAVLFGYLYLITRSIYVTTGMHAAVNVLGSHILKHGKWVHLELAGQWIIYYPTLAIAIIGAHIYYVKRSSSQAA